MTRRFSAFSAHTNNWHVDPTIIYLVFTIGDNEKFSNRIQVRSRGRHDPGSGPYTNRIAIGGSWGTQDGRYFTRLSRYYLDKQRRDEYPPYAAKYIYWDGTRLTDIEIHPPLPGSPLVEEHHWYVRWSTKIVLPDTVRVWGNERGCYWKYIYTPQYSAYSHYHQFGDSEDSAISFATALAMDYTHHGEYPSAYLRSGEVEGYFHGDLNLIRREPRLSLRLDHLYDELENDLTNIHIESGMANAYVDACNKLPHTNGINNIANVIQTFSSIKNILQGKLTEIGDLGSIWLAHRYEWQTSMMDVEEATELLDRLGSLIGTTIRSNGYYKAGEWTFKCSLRVQTSIFSEAQSFAEKWGIQLSGYNLWDMVPYSFIVDWFLGIGDLLERWQNEDYAMRINPTDVWCSEQCQGINEFGDYELFYHRTNGRPMIPTADLDVMSRSPSSVTVVKRAIDVVAMFA
jgi:hypothetical protein